jgi:hypothetical protein
MNEEILAIPRDKLWDATLVIEEGIRAVKAKGTLDEDSVILEELEMWVENMRGEIEEEKDAFD